MPLSPPPLDARRHADLVAQALARIPVHTPEWTHLNPSDPGVALVDVFAFLTETLLYRLNQVPEANRRKFLSLLGIPLRAAVSARGLVAFTNELPDAKTVTLPRDLELGAGPVKYRTALGLDVLPVEAQALAKLRVANPRPELKARYRDLYASFLGANAEAEPDLYETTPLAADGPPIDLDATVDDSLWIALLLRATDRPTENKPSAWAALRTARRAELAGKTLTLGLLPVLRDASQVLGPAPTGAASTRNKLEFQMPQVPPNALLPDAAAQRGAAYRTLESLNADDLLARPGIVQLRLPDQADDLRLWENLEPLEAGADEFPPALLDPAQEQRVVTWLRVRTAPNVPAAFQWAGINAALVEQRARITDEALPNGNGEPDQTCRLQHAPLIAESVRIRVHTAADVSSWLPVDDLLAAGAEVTVADSQTPPGTPPAKPAPSERFTVEAESGEVRFGDGFHGRRPPRSALLRAEYDATAGREGNVPAGAIKQGNLPAGLKVTNPVRTWGGAEAETEAEAELTIPRQLRHRDRLVSAEDFRDVAWRAPGIEMGRAEVLSAWRPTASNDEPGAEAGAVTLLVIPRRDSEQPDAPRPDRLFLETLCRHLEPRRLVTTELCVRGPEYVGIWISVGLSVVPGASSATAREAVKQALLEHLSPLPPPVADPAAPLPAGGWPLRKPVVDRELLAVVARVANVLAVNEVLLARDGGTVAQATLPMKRLQLPRVLGIAVTEGSATPLAALQGRGPAATGGGRPPRFVPVPVLPREC